MKIPGELRNLTNKGKIAIVMGAGVSASTSPSSKIATWKGLLEHGIKHCTENGTKPLNHSSAQDLQKMLDSDDLDNWLAIATLIERKLGCPSDAWNKWISKTVGGLEVENPSLIEAIFSINAPILTTNYDTLLSSPALSQTKIPLDWQQSNGTSLFERNPQGYVLHLHGNVERPENIIFGIRSYTNISADEGFQSYLKHLSFSYGLLFIGFGSGFDDPNFQPLLEFIAEHGGPFDNYVLVRSGEESIFDKVKNLNAVAYGDEHKDLPNFIRSIPYGTERLVYHSGHMSSEFYEAGDTFKDNSISPEIVFVPRGEFETSSHKAVYIDEEFGISKFPISVKEWEFFCSERGAKYRKLIGDRNDDNTPVVGVTLDDALAYLDWLSELSGHRYRLPTENEWEYAARAGTQTNFWWGDDVDAKLANYRDSNNGRVLASNSFNPNPFGIVGQLGNIWEWTADNYHDEQSADQQARLTNSTNKEGNQFEWVVKGGCFYYDKDSVRPEARLGIERDSVFNSVGFRAVREIPSTIDPNSEYLLASGIGAFCLSAQVSKDGFDLCLSSFEHDSGNLWRVGNLSGTRQFTLTHVKTGMILVQPEQKDDYSKPFLVKENNKLKSRSKWSLYKHSGGYIISAFSSNKALDVDGGKVKSQQNVILFERHGNFNQIWNLIDAKHLL